MAARRRYELPERYRCEGTQASDVVIYVLIGITAFVFIWLGCAMAGIDAGYY